MTEGTACESPEAGLCLARPRNSKEALGGGAGCLGGEMEGASREGGGSPGPVCMGRTWALSQRKVGALEGCGPRRGRT